MIQFLYTLFAIIAGSIYGLLLVIMGTMIFLGVLIFVNLTYRTIIEPAADKASAVLDNMVNGPKD